MSLIFKNFFERSNEEFVFYELFMSAFKRLMLFGEIAFWVFFV